MNRPTTRPLTRTIIVLVLVALFAALMSAAGAAPDKKTFTGVISPTTVAAGQQVDFMLKVTNTSSSAPLGGIEITPPAGFDVDAGNITFDTAGWSLLSTSPLRVAADTSQDRLSPGQSIVITLPTTVDVVQSTDTTYTFGLAARQANNFSGTYNDLNLDSGQSVLDVTVTGAAVMCHGNSVCTSPSFSEVDTSVQVTVTCQSGGDCGLLAVDVNQDFATTAGQTIYWSPPSGAIGEVHVLMTIDKESYTGNPNALVFKVVKEGAEPQVCDASVGCSYTVGHAPGGDYEIDITLDSPADPRGFV